MPIANDGRELLRRVQFLMKEERWRDAINLLRENISMVENHSELLWNLGWAYLKLERTSDAQKYLTKATRLAPKSHRCKFGLGMVYLERKQYKKAVTLLSEALQMHELYVTRIGLALAYLAQGRVEKAENAHLEGIRLRPNDSQRYDAYADFLFDVGRDAEAKKMGRKASELRRLN